VRKDEDDVRQVRKDDDDVRLVRKDEDDIRQRLADALVSDPSRSFWAEIKRMRNSHTANSLIVDGCTDSSSISQAFLSVPYNTVD